MAYYPQKLASRSFTDGTGTDNGWRGRKYQFMEMNLQKRMGGLKEKIPDIQKTLDSIKFLKLRKVRTCRH